jgi:hypothetical protein
MAETTLYFGDNLKILGDSICDDKTHLGCVDPQFNASANVLLRSPKGNESHAQTTAVEGTWHWNEQANG